MSLLRDALRARKGASKEQGAEPVVFKGPVIDADELLGGSQALDALKKPEVPSPDELKPAAIDPDAIDGSEYKHTASGGDGIDTSSLGLDQQSDFVEYTEPGSPESDGHKEPAAGRAIDPAIDEEKKAAHAENIQTEVEVSAKGIDSSPDGIEFLVAEKPTVNPRKKKLLSADTDAGDTFVRAQSTEFTAQQSATDFDTESSILRTQSDTPADTKQVAADEGRSNRLSAAVAGKSMNLDPLFFVIIAIASLGLFASLYALVTQNDAFVSNEFAELRARQSALNSLLVEEQRPGAELVSSVESVAPLRESVPDGQSEDDKNAEAVGPSSEVADPARTSASVSVPVAETKEQLPGASEAEQITDAQVTDDLINGTGNQGAPLGEQEILALQLELSELRQSVASQNLRISEFINRNTSQQAEAISQSRMVADKELISQDVARKELVAPERPPAAVVSNDSASDRAKKPGNEVARDLSIEADTPGDATAEITGAVSGAYSLEVQRSGKQVDGGSSTQGADFGSVDDSAGFATIVGQAFYAYSTGNLKLAGSLYDRALQLEPYNRDANLGVAAVAVNAGDYNAAIQRYRHLLSLNPGDVVAFSALLNLVATTRNSAIENEMIVHSMQHRNTPALHAALGNYYSLQARWHDASQSYAEAVTLSPETADYLYNLAVSLDNLGDSRAAMETYQRAISLSELGTFTFSVVDASARLQVLQAN